MTKAIIVGEVVSVNWGTTKNGKSFRELVVEEDSGGGWKNTFSITFWLEKTMESLGELRPKDLVCVEARLRTTVNPETSRTSVLISGDRVVTLARSVVGKPSDVPF